MEKFNRNYKIYFEIGKREKETNNLIPEELIEVNYPFTLNFECSGGLNYSNSGRCQLQLLNLSEDVRKKLWKDNWYNTKYILMQLHAGYGDVMPLIFYGFITQCHSYRDGGKTEYVTEILADDNSLISIYGFSNVTFIENTPAHNVLYSLLDEINGYSLGYLSPTLPPLKRDKTFIGQTLDLIGEEYGNYNIFIDKGELNIIGDNEVLPSELMVITDESGLLGSPKRADQFLKVKMIFEPRLKIGQAVELLSTSLPWFNGLYRVNAVVHSGEISPVICGALITEVTLQLGNTIFNELKKPSQGIYTGKSTNGTWNKPVEGIISSPFGLRVHPIKKIEKFHSGIDIAAPLNTPVYAPANGRIISASLKGGYGKAIEMDNGIIQEKRVSSLFGHLNSWAVTANQQVNKGDLIGYVGSTGNSTGPHLHFAVRENGNPVNPTKYIGNYE